MHSTAKNRLQSVLHRLNVQPPAGDLFARKQREWWKTIELSVTERLLVEQDLATHDHLASQIGQIEAELQRLSTSIEERPRAVLT